MNHSLSKPLFYLLITTSLIVVAFGQPAWMPWLGLFAAASGHAIFWRAAFSLSSRKQIFWMATLWFTAVQWIQLSWFISHPYSYIYPLHFLLSFLMGLQYGCLAFFITPVTIRRISSIAGIAGFWTLMEWIRLFLLSGFTWNPLGLALTGALIPLQAASLVGIYGLSFWVIFVNMLALRAWENRRKISTFLWILCACLPYLYGALHLQWHEHASKDHQEKMSAVLVQTAFPAEESMGMKQLEFHSFVLMEWKKIFEMVKPQIGKKIDLLVLPEFVVPYGTYTFVYEFEAIKTMFLEAFGEGILKSFPPLEIPFALTRNGLNVNNAFITQTIANYFGSSILIGLEDVEENEKGEREYFSGALYFTPFGKEPIPIQRYEKRVLVPMGEYIPFSFCRSLAASYGVSGSFTCGKEAKIFKCKHIPFGASICYEETFGDLTRDIRLNGGQVVVNLTSDVWYPDSRLTWQHFDHARLRTVETGIPLLRACNTGITCSIDSVGRVIDLLPEYNSDGSWYAGSLYTQVSTYAYSTLYTSVGDSLIVAISLLSLLFFCLQRKQRS